MPGVLVGQTVAPTELVYVPFDGSRTEGLGAAAQLAFGKMVAGAETPPVAAIVGNCGIETEYFFDVVNIPALSFSPPSELDRYPTKSHIKTEPSEDVMERALKSTMEALGAKQFTLVTVDSKEGKALAADLLMESPDAAGFELLYAPDYALRDEFMYKLWAEEYTSAFTQILEGSPVRIWVCFFPSELFGIIGDSLVAAMEKFYGTAWKDEHFLFFYGSGAVAAVQSPTGAHMTLHDKASLPPSHDALTGAFALAVQEPASAAAYMEDLEAFVAAGGVGGSCAVRPPVQDVAAAFDAYYALMLAVQGLVNSGVAISDLSLDSAGWTQKVRQALQNNSTFSGGFAGSRGPVSFQRTHAGLANSGAVEILRLGLGKVAEWRQAFGTVFIDGVPEIPGGVYPRVTIYASKPPFRHKAPAPTCGGPAAVVYVLGAEVFTIDKAPITAPGSQRVPCPAGSVGTVLLTCAQSAEDEAPQLTAEPSCEPVASAVCDAVHSSCKDAFVMAGAYKTSCDLCDQARAASTFYGFEG